MRALTALRGPIGLPRGGDDVDRKLTGKYAIVGVGQSPLGKVPDMGPLDLLAVAAKNAIEDSGIDKNDIDGLITRGPDDINNHHQRIGQVLGAHDLRLRGSGQRATLAPQVERPVRARERTHEPFERVVLERA